MGRIEYLVAKDLAEGTDPRRHITWSTERDGTTGLLSDALGLYRFTTENILGYLPLLDVKDRRCLTVAASGDHVINMLMAGAREIVAFDVTPHAEEITRFKMQALVDLDWKNVNDFRRNLWLTALRPQVFGRLLDRIPISGRLGPETILAKAIGAFPIGDADMIFKRWQVGGRNSYLADENAFEAAKDACRTALEDGRVSFVDADVRELPFLDIGRFDAISLSNILQSRMDRRRHRSTIARDRKSMSSSNSTRQRILQGLVDTMVWPVAEMLNAGGRMMAAYCYACDERKLYTDLGLHGDNGENERPHGSALAAIPSRKMTANGNLSRTASRLQAFSPRDGFTIHERQWPLVNEERDGVDIGVMIHRFS
jgi:hypothetical protein